MKKIFLGTSFSGNIDGNTGYVNKDFRTKVESVLEALRLAGFEIFCAVEHEGWVASDMPAEIGVKEDLARIDAADAFVAYLLAGVVSEGLQFEMGHATHAGKPTVLLTEPAAKIGYFNQGIIRLGKVKHFELTSVADLANDIWAHLK